MQFYCIKNKKDNFFILEKVSGNSKIIKKTVPQTDTGGLV